VNEVILEMRSITKTFPGVNALDNVNLAVRRGEIHAVVGENGAGKSTLMKIISGQLQPDAGRIMYKGEPVHFGSGRAAEAAGIAMIHQELNLVPHLSVAENIFLAREPMAGWFVDRPRLHADARRCLQRLGVDIDPKAVQHARERYGAQPNVRFEQGDCTALRAPDASFDLVVSFETLEHVAAQEALVAGFARVLSADGVLVISSPDKRTYSDATGFRNEFHVRELYRDELLALLRPHFPHVRLYGQKLLFESAIWSEQGRGNGTAACATVGADAASVEPGLAYDPLYFIAVCSKHPLADASLPALSLFGDREESVYRHYNGEVRRNMAAGGRIAELEAELESARRERDQARAAHVERTQQRTAMRPWWRRWFGPAR